MATNKKTRFLSSRMKKSTKHLRDLTAYKENKKSYEKENIN